MGTDSIISRIPGVSKEELMDLLNQSTSSNRDFDAVMDVDMGYDGTNNELKVYDDDSYQVKDDPFSASDRRLKIMKNALRPVSQEQLVSMKLDSSELINVFQDSFQFLKDLDLQELQYWELLNEEFDKGMQALEAERRSKVGTNSLIQGDADQYRELGSLDTPRELLYKSMTTKQSAFISDNLRKRVKQEINDQGFELNLYED